jgi:hypothetical protein
VRLISKGKMGEQTAHACAMAFHENAGLGQVDFDLPFLKFSLSFMAEGCSERPGAVKGAFCAASANP